GTYRAAASRHDASVSRSKANDAGSLIQASGDGDLSAVEPKPGRLQMEIVLVGPHPRDGVIRLSSSKDTCGYLPTLLFGRPPLLHPYVTAETNVKHSRDISDSVHTLVARGKVLVD